MQRHGYNIKINMQGLTKLPLTIVTFASLKFIISYTIFYIINENRFNYVILAAEQNFSAGSFI